MSDTQTNHNPATGSSRGGRNFFLGSRSISFDMIDRHKEVVGTSLEYRLMLHCGRLGTRLDYLLFCAVDCDCEHISLVILQNLNKCEVDTLKIAAITQNI